MMDKQEIAELTITPSSGPGPPLPTYRLGLVQIGDEFLIEATRQLGESESRESLKVDREAANREVLKLKQAKIPAFPKSPLVCDGEYVELCIHGEYSDLTLGWWTVAPDGAESLADFADWMRTIGLPDDEITPEPMN
jgi:hypothetical protein